MTRTVLEVSCRGCVFVCVCLGVGVDIGICTPIWSYHHIHGVVLCISQPFARHRRSLPGSAISGLTVPAPPIFLFVTLIQIV